MKRYLMIAALAALTLALAGCGLNREPTQRESARERSLPPGFEQITAARENASSTNEHVDIGVGEQSDSSNRFATSGEWQDPWDREIIGPRANIFRDEEPNNETLNEQHVYPGHAGQPVNIGGQQEIVLPPLGHIGQPPIVSVYGTNIESAWRPLQMRFPVGSLWRHDETHTDYRGVIHEGRTALVYAMSDSIFGDAGYDAHTEFEALRAADILVLNDGRYFLVRNIWTGRLGLVTTDWYGNMRWDYQMTFEEIENVGIRSIITRHE